VVGCRFTVLGSGLLLYRVCASESYLNICLFKDVGDFSDLVAVICECSPFLWFLLSVLSVRALRCKFHFNLVMRWTGKLLFFAMARIFCHSVYFLSVVRGSDVILLVR
jgi:hypothetical protein